MNSMERFDDTSLPSKEQLLNRLYDSHVSEEQYKYADGVWETLKCNTMKVYYHHYLVTDILLLSDVFENFRKMSLETYWIPFIIIACLVYPGTRYRCRLGIDNRS